MAKLTENPFKFGNPVRGDYYFPRPERAFSASAQSRLGRLDEEDVRAGIQDLLDELTNLGSKVIVALDEFQQISQLEDKGWLEATVRTHFQKLPNVSFLFTGSRKGLISEMLNDPSRPLYRSCQMIELALSRNLGTLGPS